MKAAQVAGGMGRRLPGGRVGRTEVEEGSKAWVEGVRRALRCCVMLSSIVVRERRRKSGGGLVRLRQKMGWDGEGAAHLGARFG